MHHIELNRLIQEYRNAETSEDKLILRKLEAIRALCSDCKGDEMIFAHEIADEFCRVIHLLRDKQEKTIIAAPVLPRVTGWIPQREQTLPYQNGRQLLGAFYNHFKEEHELSYFDIKDYPFKDEADKKQKVNSTMMDYVARINTFSNKYLSEMFGAEEMQAAGVFDDILFVYQHLELIIARFSTKDANGESVKKRLNIRSALRKLNEFKCAEEARR